MCPRHAIGVENFWVELPALDEGEVEECGQSCCCSICDSPDVGLFKDVNEGRWMLEDRVEEVEYISQFVRV